MYTPTKKEKKAPIWGSGNSSNDGFFSPLFSPPRDQGAKKTELQSDNQEQNANLNLRERRNRHKTSSSLYRPLSILTQSVLMPFSFDTDQAFDTIKSNEHDAMASARKRRVVNTNEQRATPKKALKYEATTPSSISSNAAGLQALPFSKEPTMDLLTALKTTNPEKDSSSQVTADYATLAECPVPDLREHPFFSSLPFKSKSSSPMLFTTSSPDDVRKTRSRESKCSERTTKTSESDFQRDTLERKKSFFGLTIKTPGSIYSHNNATGDDALSIVQRLSTQKELEASHTAQRSSSLVEYSDKSRESGSSKSSAGGRRKLSDILRTKMGGEKTPIPQHPSDAYFDLESPNLGRQDLEIFLRRTTFSPTYDYDASDGYPRHPATGRGWRSRNLKCTTCTEDSCACCRRCCCAYKAAVLALDNHIEGSDSRQDALLRIQEITKLFPYGKEAPTFLQCTRGFGSAAGCGRMVCPDCCSICPVTACSDTQCKTCKPLMWEECTWHKKKSTPFEDHLPIGLGIKV